MIAADEIVRAISTLNRKDLPALLAAIAARMAEPDPTLDQVKGQDRALTAQQVAEKLNLSVDWVRQNAEGELKTARVKLGGALRFSEVALEGLIRRRTGG